MQLLKIDQKNNFFKVIPDNLDDLWHLERIIEPGDIVSAKTERKIKPKQEGMEVTKENVFYQIQAERIEFHESSGHLRILGVIVGGSPPELVELKAHHSIDAFSGKEIEVKKNLLKKHQIERLEKAKKSSGRGKTLLVVLDDESAELALLKEFGFEHKGKIASGKSGKRFKSEEKENVFFEKIAAKVKEIEPEKTVFAGPGFTKNNFKKFLQEKNIRLNAFFEHADSVGTTGFNELISGGAIEKIVEEIQVVKETKLVEKLLEGLGQGRGLVTVDKEQVEKAIYAGAVEHLLVSDDYLLNNRQTAEELLEKAESQAGEIHILSTKSVAGKKVHGFGGLCAILRFNPFR